ncbi:hypothetical protein HS121_17560 [bacterium]|nr:hypothetical protein [bacterium]
MVAIGKVWNCRGEISFKTGPFHFIHFEIELQAGSLSTILRAFPGGTDCAGVEQIAIAGSEKEWDRRNLDQDAPGCGRGLAVSSLIDSSQRDEVAAIDQANQLMTGRIVNPDRFGFIQLNLVTEFFGEV